LPLSIIELTFFSNSNIKNVIPNHIPCINILFDDPPIGYICYKDDKCCEYQENVYHYNQQNLIDNLPITIKIIKISDPHYLCLIKKIPFGCIVTDSNNKILAS
jgi:hypothetical protein